MRFEWDENKNRQNLRKHGIRFETAKLVFKDPYQITTADMACGHEDRWITMGAVGLGTVLVVVHTWFEQNYEEVIRIISARPAESHERRFYEETHKTAKTRNHGDSRKKRQRD
jgi:uncharacterized DUF497 family protein